MSSLSFHAKSIRCVRVDLSRSFQMLRKRTNPLVRCQRSHAMLAGNSLDATLVRVFASLTNNSTQRTIETNNRIASCVPVRQEPAPF